MQHISPRTECWHSAPGSPTQCWHSIKNRERVVNAGTGRSQLLETNPVGAPYLFFVAACFEAAACCFFWFAVFALTCFCAACLCTDFGDLSPIIGLTFGFWFTHLRHISFSEVV